MCWIELHVSHYINRVLDCGEDVTYAVPKTTVLSIQLVEWWFDPYGLESFGYEGKVELATECEVPQGIQGTKDVDRVKRGEQSDSPVFGGRHLDRLINVLVDVGRGQTWVIGT